MINESAYKKYSHLTKKTHSYMNPLFFKQPKNFLNLLPLFCKSSLVYFDKSNNFYSSSNFFDYVGKKYFIPTAIEENSLTDSISPSRSLLRKNLLDEALFTKAYSESIDTDYDNKELKEKFSKSKLDKLGLSFTNSLFSANWDLYFMKLFSVGMISHSSYAAFCKYKLESEISTSESLIVENSVPIVSFLKDINFLIPSRISVDDMKSFRREKVIRKFQNWLNEKLIDVSSEDDVNKVKHLVNSYNELIKSQEQYLKIPKSAATILFSSVGGLVGSSYNAPVLGGSIGAVLGESLNLASPWLNKRLSYRFNNDPWTFLLSDIK